jgi:hypothetical protein
LLSYVSIDRVLAKDRDTVTSCGFSPVGKLNISQGGNMAKDVNDEGAEPVETSPIAARVSPAGPVSSEELAELRELTNSLLRAAGALQSEDVRTREFRGLVDDVRAAARTMTLAAPAASYVENPAVGGEEGCGCGPCECLSSSCCLFEVVMTHARATEMQLPTEPFDSNVLPLAEMEIRIFASIDRIGSVYPDLFSTFLLRKNIARPGAWKPIGRKIGTVAVCKGQSKSIVLEVEAAEIDEGGVEALGIRDEHGTGSATMVLNCCMTVPFTCLVDVQLTEYGLGGGAIEVKFEARKICC